jgi:hypothetical protein
MREAKPSSPAGGGGRGGGGGEAGKVVGRVREGVMQCGAGVGEGQCTNLSGADGNREHMLSIPYRMNHLDG